MCHVQCFGISKFTESLSDPKLTNLLVVACESVKVPRAAAGLSNSRFGGLWAAVDALEWRDVTRCSVQLAVSAVSLRPRRLCLQVKVKVRVTAVSERKVRRARYGELSGISVQVSWYRGCAVLNRPAQHRLETRTK